MTYRGYKIKQVSYQDTVCYRVSIEGIEEIASSLSAAKKWVDCHINAVNRNLSRSLDLSKIKGVQI